MAKDQNYWLVNGKLLSESEKKDAAEKLRKWSTTQTREELKHVFWSRLKYKKYWDELCVALQTNLPQSYQWLISLLNGNPYSVSQNGEYLLWLLTSAEKWEDTWKDIAHKRNLVQKSREILTWDKIREIYRRLPEELKKKFFRNEHVYHEQIDEIREYFWEWMGSTFDWLITVLWWDKDARRWGKYVMALMESQEKWEEFLKWYSEHKKEINKQKKIKHKRDKLKKIKARRENANRIYVH